MKKRIWRQKIIWRQANYADYAWLIMQNMSLTMVKSCRPFHTIIICNMKSPPCTKLEILDFAQKLPGHAQIKEISISWDQIFFWTWNFQGWFLTIIVLFLKFSAKSNEAISRKWPKTPILETKTKIIWRHIFSSKIELRHFSTYIKG